MTTPLTPSRPVPAPDPRPVSAWVRRFAPLIPEHSQVLDVACGSGRHAVFFAARGCQVTALDRDIRQCPAMDNLTRIMSDLENGSPWPLPEQQFDAVIVTHYLWRPLFPRLCASVRDGGMLLYETFAEGHQHYGRPHNPDFLLQRGELLRLTQPLLTPVAFEEGIVGQQAVMQRLCAVRGSGPYSLP